MPFSCNHSKTEILASMQPISWSGLLVQTEGAEEPHTYPKIVCEKTYVAEKDGEDIMPSLWGWLKSLRGVIYESWCGNFPDVSSCVMTESEKKAHADATKCYVCLDTFKETSSCEGEGEDVLDFMIAGEKLTKKARKCTKVLDHSHRTRAYRGEPPTSSTIHNSHIKLPSSLPSLFRCQLSEL